MIFKTVYVEFPKEMVHFLYINFLLGWLEKSVF